MVYFIISQSLAPNPKKGCDVRGQRYDMFRADLHCHTHCSDGSLSPEELILLAEKIGLKGLAITDHDSIAAYSIALPLAKQRDILLGTGVEFSCVHQGVSVHVLGYAFTPDALPVKTLCEKHQKRRKERNAAILANLRRHSLFIEERELPQKGTIGRPHIAQIMLQKNYVGSLQEAFQRYLAEGKCCYEQGASFSVEETLEVLHSAQAKAFLAHPHLMEKAAFARKLLELPFDGVECYYAKCLPQDEGRWLRLAKERKLLVSGGSDFHGSFKPHIPLGASWVDEQTFYTIFQHA